MAYIKYALFSPLDMFKQKKVEHSLPDAKKKYGTQNVEQARDVNTIDATQFIEGLLFLPALYLGVISNHRKQGFCVTFRLFRFSHHGRWCQVP